MPRVVLVQPPHRDTFGYSMPPLGPLHLGAAARDAGHEVVFLDFALMLRRGELATGGARSTEISVAGASRAADRPVRQGDDPSATTDPAMPADATLAVLHDCAERILAASPDVIGLGVMISSMPIALALVAILHERAPEVPVLLGGQGPETIEEAVLEAHPGISAVFVGEADVTFPEFLAALDTPDAWASIPGLVVRDPTTGTITRTAPRPVVPQLDDVPPPAWDLAEPPAAYAAAADALDEGALFPIDLGRGCSFACSFCTTPIFWGRTARHLTASRAVDELDRLAALGHVGCAYVTHDLFTVDRRRVLDICAEKIRRGNTLPWECRTRIDLVDDELLEALRDAGCRRILYGVESATRDGLARVNKGGTQHDVDVLDVLRRASDIGVASILGLMIGVPGETLADVEANLRLMRRAAVIDGVSLSLHWFNVLPGNGHLDAFGDALTFEPGLHADLVRGYDLFPHDPSPHLAQLIASDPVVFAAFRVAPTADLSTRTLFLLTRNAHLLLEVFPRTLDLLGRRLVDSTGTFTPLLDALRAFLERIDTLARPADLTEPLVLERAAAVELFLRDVLQRDDPALHAVALYEGALFGTEEPQVVRVDTDPRPLLSALDADAPLPEPTADPAALLFTRHGDVVRARAVSTFLADVFDARGDPDAITPLWPDVEPATVEAATTLLDTTLADADERETSWR